MAKEGVRLHAALTFCTTVGAFFSLQSSTHPVIWQQISSRQAIGSMNAHGARLEVVYGTLSRGHDFSIVTSRWDG